MSKTRPDKLRRESYSGKLETPLENTHLNASIESTDSDTAQTTDTTHPATIASYLALIKIIASSLSDLSQLAILELSQSTTAFTKLILARFVGLLMIVAVYISSVILIATASYELSSSATVAVAAAIAYQLISMLILRFVSKRLTRLIGFKHSKEEIAKFKGALNEFAKSL